MGFSFLSMTDVELDGRRVLIREDFNVPIEAGRVTSDERLRRAVPTLKLAIEAGARVILMSHLGRPTEGQADPTLSLAPVAQALSALLNHPVSLYTGEWEQLNVERGQVILLENIRFMPGEAANDQALAKRLASLCDVFVMDAFATAHRAQASTEGVARYAPIACAGPLLIEELVALNAAFDAPLRPLVAVVGGSKVSTKIHLLESLLHKVDSILVGGGIANTFLKAAGHEIGLSLYEADWVAPAQAMLAKAAERGVAMPLPVDVVVAKEFSAQAVAEVKRVTDIAADDRILDVGPATRATYPGIFQAAKTIVWNGPVGVFEFDAFSGGTRALAEAIAASSAYSLAGGGDTISAMEKFHVTDRVSYISTGGGAFLEYLEGRELPALRVLTQAYNNTRPETYANENGR